MGGGCHTIKKLLNWWNNTLMEINCPSESAAGVCVCVCVFIVTE